MHKSFLCLVSLIVLGACASPPPSNAESSAAIIGGQAAPQAALDVVGVIAINRRLTDGSTATSLCTGTLIAPRVVVTAFHCFHDPEGATYLGAQYALGPSVDAVTWSTDVADVTYNTASTGTSTGFGADVAIVYLKEPITTIRPARLGTLAAADLGANLTIAGYGAAREGDNGPEAAGTRRTGTVKLRAQKGNIYGIVGVDFDKFKTWALKQDPARTDQDLRAQYDSFALSEGYEVWVGGGAQGAMGDNPCAGDSGGPLYRIIGGELVIYGVSSQRASILGCSAGGSYATFGPDTAKWVEDALTPTDVCEGVSAVGECRGTVLFRCSVPEEGARRVIQQDCAATGLTCVPSSDREAACVAAAPAVSPELP